MSLRERLFTFSPWFEVAVKSVYWRSRMLHQLIASRGKRAARPAVSISPKAIDFERIVATLHSMGVREGDIVILHSSGAALRPTGLTPAQICQRLKSMLGPAGTLAAPAIPLFREEPSGPDRLTDDICRQRLVYDVKGTPVWTGAIPKALLTMPGALRSRHPLNSMAAWGPDAEPMMRNNIAGDRPTACGRDSSWKYCADRNAKIVCLGVDSAHSLTMIHVAEDSYESFWPIPDWYRDRLFTVRDGDFQADITVRERRPHWAIFYGERTLQATLVKCGVIRQASVDGLRVEVCESAELLAFLNRRKSKGWPYYRPFWHRRRK